MSIRWITQLVGLLALFSGSAVGAPAPEDVVYLFTSFRDNGEDGLRFLWSEDGYKWTEVPGKFLKPRVGPSQLMRDPSLLARPGRHVPSRLDHRLAEATRASATPLEGPRPLVASSSSSR